MAIMIPVSAGGLIDQIVILRIKTARIRDRAKLDVVNHELAALTKIREAVPLLGSAAVLAAERELAAANERLWGLEDELRRFEAADDFGAGFIAAARGVYQTNDRRSALKKEIDRMTGSEFSDEKSYAQ